MVGNAGRRFYGVDRFSGLLRQYDASTGAVQGSLAMTVSGHPVAGAFGLAVDPTSNKVYALLRYSGVDTALVTLGIDAQPVWQVTGRQGVSIVDAARGQVRYTPGDTVVLPGAYAQQR